MNHRWLSDSCSKSFLIVGAHQPFWYFMMQRGLSDADLQQIKQVSDWLTSSQKPAAVGQVLSVYTVPQASSQLTCDRWHDDDDGRHAHRGSPRGCV